MVRLHKLLPLFFLTAACGAPISPPSLAAPIGSAPPVASSPAADPCRTMDAERRRVPELLAQGRLDRTVRVIERADSICPETAPQTWAPLITTLAELRRAHEVARVADRIDATPDAPASAREAARRAREVMAAEESNHSDAKARQAASQAFQTAQKARDHRRYAEAKAGFLEAWSLDHPNGDALFWAGTMSRHLGGSAEAQRLFDRAVDELERQAGAPIVPELVTRMPQTKDEPESALDRWWNPIQTFDFSTDSRAIASGADDCVVRVWNLAEGTVLSQRHQARINFIGFSPDSRSVALIAGTRLQLWGFGQPGKPNVLDERVVNNAAFSPDGSTLAWGGVLHAKSHPVRLARVASLGEPRREWRHDNDVHQVAWSPDGRLLATAPDAPVLRLWEARSGTVHRDIRTSSPVTAAPAFSRDSRRLAAACGEKIQLWDVESAAELRKVEGHRERVLSLAWSHDGKTLVSGSADGTVRVWNTESGAELRKLYEGMPVQAVAFSPNGSLIGFAAQEGPIQIVTPEGRLVLSLHSLPPGGEALILSAGSRPRVEILGRDRDRVAESLFCRVGNRTYPYELCRDRVESSRLGWKLLNNDPSPDVP